ncbi:spore coat protein CotH [Geobacillus sp. 46C-IIa]|uniref:spore coat protein CotH n=1 Tax=Geobacillus sp. 46C-IIa TaxID=1963025 RepID=UPI0009C0F315|nr:spore coat protein CotH [Geobacillus sp. 46C-IIa]OQP07169.1 spore coat protein CotH [Geobacillus sp. 46C-IIa]
MTVYDMHGASMPLEPNEELRSLIGKTVTVYRGGPESKTGKLLDVQSDYLALFTENELAMIYYALHHVQSISENAKANSVPSLSLDSGEPVTPVGAPSFHELLNSLVNERIQVNQGGPESKQGTLLGVSDDHITLFTKDDGLVFYHLRHIKSVRVQMKNEENKAVDAEAQAPGHEANAVEHAAPEAKGHNAMEAASEATHMPKGAPDGQEHDPTLLPVYVKAENLTDLFALLTHTWVAINRGGPEAVEGILVPGGSGYYTIVNHDEIIRMNPEHMKSISCGPKGAFQAMNATNAGDGKETDQAEAAQEPNQAGRGAKKDENAQKKEAAEAKAKQKEQGGKKKEEEKGREQEKRKEKGKEKTKQGEQQVDGKAREHGKDKKKKDDEGGKEKAKGEKPKKGGQ